MTGSAVRRGLHDAGAVLVAWALLIVAEFVVVGVSCRSLFAGNWELVSGRKLVGPIALAMLAPAAPVVVLVGRLASRGARSDRARRAVAVVAGAVLGVTGVGVTGGRHFQALAVRAAFVLGCAAVAAAGAYAAVPSLVRVLDGRRGRSFAFVAGLAGAAAFWAVDARVLVHLYPAFHALALALCVSSAALCAFPWAWRGSLAGGRREARLGAIGVVVALAASAWTPLAARRLARSDNLRFVLTEYAPLLGRAVRVASWIARPADPEEDEGSRQGAPAGEVPRALDWVGSDVLLVSVDALRADHVSAYGYARPTTPNLDALAARAAVFDRAYCPTPHTSYSVTSMMTGKAMRPLLALGLGDDSETWAGDLRRYGYKTAAFYPPAVFYIDAERFTGFEQSGLGFEYRWVEFTSAKEKVSEVRRYLDGAGPEPIFLWVHLFEPHEPYVMHPEHPFGGASPLPVDAYDSEVAYADDAIGELVRAVRERRPRVAVIVTADHGEEFGEHGGRYHGTTCYEEQVRVPLLIEGPGVVARRVSTVVQTIDLLPTVLSAMAIPRPARVRGRDLGPVLAATSTDPGLAYAETDEQTMLARGTDRLVCARKVNACALYDLAVDPGERQDLAPRRPAVARELRSVVHGIERDQGRFEEAPVVWPDALRRGLQGESDAAEDVAALLDDVNVVIRRKAAEVTFRLGAPEVLAQARRALERDEDDEVRSWAALSVVRMGDPPPERARALVRDPSKAWRRAASVAFALRGDPRGKVELASYWREEAPPRPGLDLAGAHDLLEAIARVRDSEAVPGLLESLDFIPLRPRLAEALGRIGDTKARAPLLSLFRKERYETARPAEARALAVLGAGADLAGPLAMFAGLADPMNEAVTVARDAGILDPRRGGIRVEPPQQDVAARLSVKGLQRPWRLWVLEGAEGGELSGTVGPWPVRGAAASGSTYRVDLDPGPESAELGDIQVHLHDPKGISAVWLVTRWLETPPPLVLPLPDAGHDSARHAP